ncbi:MAG: hypothetical protein BWY15_02050 [Firmicutes bacterium ADurb.Bin193]|nr:MAG: hypothetical protein BWY15_02050 [Firmicutes bacterium ADurb.Bin193]
MSKKHIMIACILLFLAISAAVVFIVYQKTISPAIQNQAPFAAPTQTAPAPAETPPPKPISPSTQGKKVSAPNDYSGYLLHTSFDSYVIGQYNAAEITNYDDFLTDQAVIAKIGAHLNPALTDLASQYPKSLVHKEVWGGFMSVSVRKYLKDVPFWDAPNEMQPSYEGYAPCSLNYDLRTGEAIALRSVFCDNADYEAELLRALQPLVLAQDETNIRKTNKVELNNIYFNITEKGLRLFFSEDSPFLSGQEVFLDWWRFSDGVIAVFDRFPALDEKQYQAGDDQHSRKYDYRLLVKSELKYLLYNSGSCFLPSIAENAYEKSLVEQLKEDIQKKIDDNPGFEIEYFALFCERVGNYRIIADNYIGVAYDNEGAPNLGLNGVYNIKEKRRITLGEFFGKGYKQIVKEALDREKSARLEYEANEENNRYWRNESTFVSDEQFYSLLSKAELYIGNGGSWVCIVFPEAISTTRSTYSSGSTTQEVRSYWLEFDYTVQNSWR